MKRHLFGTDGIRGEAGLAPITPGSFFALGQAAATYFGKTVKRPSLLIGMDTRESGPALEHGLAAGWTAAGGNVLKAGVLPTPAVAYLVRHFGAQAGAVLSASHNPYSDNGLKFFSPLGEKLSDAQEAAIEALLDAPKKAAGSVQLGRIAHAYDARGAYEGFAASTLGPASGRPLHGMKLVVDVGNGAAVHTTPAVLRHLGATVVVMNADPNGRNINLGCGSTDMDGLFKAIKKHKAHAGLAHDGDADRVLMVDENGRLVDGDRMMGLCALHLHAHKRLPKKTLVATVMSNLGFERALQEAGIKVLRANVGDRYVLELMKKSGATLGGEQSGHVIFRGLHATGDGLITALQVLNVMKKTGKKLSALAGFFVDVPQLLVNVKTSRRVDLATVKPVAAAIAEAEAQLQGVGRVIVRWSGTEPKARVMIEGPSVALVDRLANSIAQAIQRNVR
jgi:phosphoglucosamine mutase